MGLHVEALLAVGPHGDGVRGAPGHPLAPLIVHAHHTLRRRDWRRRVEEQRLRLEVVLHRRVEVEVVLAQVGKPGDVEISAADSAEHQRVRGHLHHHVGHTFVPHPRKQRLQRRRLRGGQLRRDIAPRNPRARRTDQPDLVPRSGQPALEQIRRCRLARGPGHAKQEHAFRRPPVDLGRHLAEHGADVLHHQHGTLVSGGGDDFQAGGVGKHCPRLRALGERRAVDAGAGQRREQPARLDRGGVEADRGDLCVVSGRVDHARPGDLREVLQRGCFGVHVASLCWRLLLVIQLCRDWALGTGHCTTHLTAAAAHTALPPGSAGCSRG